MKPRKFGFFDGLLTLLVAAAALANVAAYGANGLSIGEFWSEFLGTEEKQTLVFRIDNPYVDVNGRKTSIDEHGSAPFIQDGVSLLPLKATYKTLGGSVDHDAGTGYATAKFANTLLNVKAGETNAEINGKTVTLGVAPVDKNGEIYVPARTIADALGADLSWDGETQSLTLSFKLGSSAAAEP